MLFLVVGVLLLLLKLGEIDPVAAWSWWIILGPFGLAVVWWAWADSTGLTQRRAIAKMEKRKVERRERDIDALGLGSSSRRSKAAADAAQQAQQKKAAERKRRGG